MSLRQCKAERYAGLLARFDGDSSRCPSMRRLGSLSDQVQSQATFWRELLMTITCFSTVSPALKLWSRLVKRAGLPAM